MIGAREIDMRMIFSATRVDEDIGGTLGDIQYTPCISQQVELCVTNMSVASVLLVLFAPFLAH